MEFQKSYLLHRVVNSPVFLNRSLPEFLHGNSAVLPEVQVEIGQKALFAAVLHHKHKAAERVQHVTHRHAVVVFHSVQRRLSIALCAALRVHQRLHERHFSRLRNGETGETGETRET